MKRIGFALTLPVILCACYAPTVHDAAGIAHDRGRAGATGVGSPWEDADDAPHACPRISTLPVKSPQLYEDYYGTILTQDASSLRTPQRTYRWGITNSSPLSMAYFSAYVKPNGKYGRFRASIFIDGAIKANMTFHFRAEGREGVVLKSLTIRPGQTKGVDFEVRGVRKLFIGSELRINHDTARKIVIGEPEFYTCR
ncbi:MAG: hypothetical protein GYA56_13140 [Geobacteraceae bacterium]|nr:hypothetical protein [Geobacteraceae bacterium]